MAQIDVFISYKREELAFAERVNKAFQAAGYTAVTDLNIQRADDMGDAIDGFIRAARRVVVLWTPASAASDWVRKEVREAERRGKYFGVMVDTVPPDDLPFEVRNIQYLDITEDSPKAGIDRIVADVGKLIGGPRQSAEDAQIDSAEAKADMEFFQVAQSIDTLEAYQRYIKVYPGGACKNDAQNRIAALSHWTTPIKLWLPTTAVLGLVIAAGGLWLNYERFTQAGQPDSALQEQLQTTRDALETVTRERDRAQGALRAASEKAATLTDDLETAKADLAASAGTLADLSQQNAALVDARDSAVADLAEKEAQMGALGSNLNRALANAAAEQSRAAALESDLEAATEELAALKATPAIPDYRCQTDAKEDGVFIGGACYPKSTTSLDLRNKDITDIAPLAGLPNLTQLRLWRNPDLTDIAPLDGLTNLTTLDLDNTQVADIAPLAGLTNLTRLELDNTQVANIAPLAGLTNLTHLDLNNTQVADIVPLTGLTNLTTLYLDKTQVADIAPLAGLTNLTTLYLNNTQVADIAPLDELTKLTTLDLDNTQVADIAPLDGLTNLTRLELNNAQVANIVPLTGLTNLTHLELNNTQVTDISPLAGLTNLVTLYLNGTQVADFAVLRNLGKLHRLGLPDILFFGGVFDTPENREAVQEAIRTWKAAP